jgi:hypothetical protein
MDALPRCSDLQSLVMEFPWKMEVFQFTRSEMGWVTPHENDARKFHIRHPEFKLPAFSSLQRLSLHGLWGDIGSWRTQVLQVILNSPQLKHISLYYLERYYSDTFVRARTK